MESSYTWVDQVVKADGIDMSIEDAEDRAWCFRREYANALRANGYTNVIEEKPNVPVNHPLRRLRSLQLYQRMLYIIPWRKTETFYEENFNRFVRGVAAQPTSCKTEQWRAPVIYEKYFIEGNHQAKTTLHFLKKNIAKEKTVSSVMKSQQNIALKSKVNKKHKRGVYEAPLCLNSAV